MGFWSHLQGFCGSALFASGCIARCCSSSIRSPCFWLHSGPRCDSLLFLVFVFVFFSICVVSVCVFIYVLFSAPVYVALKLVALEFFGIIYSPHMFCVFVWLSVCGFLVFYAWFLFLVCLFLCFSIWFSACTFSALYTLFLRRMLFVVLWVSRFGIAYVLSLVVDICMGAICVFALWFLSVLGASHVLCMFSQYGHMAVMMFPNLRFLRIAVIRLLIFGIVFSWRAHVSILQIQFLFRSLYSDRPILSHSVLL